MKRTVKEWEVYIPANNFDGLFCVGCEGGCTIRDLGCLNINKYADCQPGYFHLIDNDIGWEIKPDNPDEEAT